MTGQGGNFVRHIGCPKCGSSDGNALYDTGDTYCFSCQTLVKNKGGAPMEPLEDYTKEYATTKPFHPVEVYNFDKPVRGISEAIYKKYGYYKTSEGNHCINHCDKEGTFISQKFRYKDKTFSWSGNAKKAVPFGMNLWRSGGKRITITEGELDCLSVAEALGGKYPVISINNGAQAAYKDLKEHLEFLNTYEEIVLWFDGDEPGQKAVKEVSSLFQPGKVFIINNGQYKDANEILIKAGKSTVLQYYYEAKQYSPDGIVNARDGGFESFLSTSNADVVYTTPFRGLELTKGSIYTIVSGSGMGKSTLTKELGYHLMMSHGLTIGHVALEESNAISKRAYVGIDMNLPLTKKKNFLKFIEMPEYEEAFKESYERVIEPGKLWLYNHFGSIASDNLINKLRYLIKGAGCDFIILDHISIVVSGLEDLGENERRTIDVLMTKLRSLVEETGVGMILVSHLKRPQGKGHENGAQIQLSDLRGSGGIGQMSDFVLGIEGDQQDEALKRIRRMRMIKDREGGETGIRGSALYVPETGRLVDYSDQDTEVSFDDESDTDNEF